MTRDQLQQSVFGDFHEFWLGRMVEKGCPPVPSPPPAGPKWNGRTELEPGRPASVARLAARASIADARLTEVSAKRSTSVRGPPSTALSPKPAALLANLLTARGPVSFCPHQKCLFYQGFSMISDNLRRRVFLPTGTRPIHARDAQTQGFPMVFVGLWPRPGLHRRQQQVSVPPAQAGNLCFTKGFPRFPITSDGGFFLPTAKSSFYQCFLMIPGCGFLLPTAKP